MLARKNLFRTAFPRVLVVLLGITAVVEIGCCSTKRWQAPPEIQRPVDKAIQPLICRHRSIGIVVGVIKDNEYYTISYGKTRYPFGKTPNGDTIFEIGSISKTFTGILLARLVEEGLVKLDDAADRGMPSGCTLPAFEDRKITFADLATHTSGLPRLPDDLEKTTGYNPANPYAHYTEQNLYDFLARCTLSGKPGTRYEYSNLGMGLLGHLLGRISGNGYENALIHYVTTPLGMKDTSITLSESQKNRVAQGYSLFLDFDFVGLPTAVENWDLGVFAGAGGIRTSMNDMLKFLAANMDIGENPIQSAVASSLQPRFEVNDRLRVGLAWHLAQLKDGSDTLVVHDGGTGGYRSLIAFLRDKKIGIVVLSNSDANINEAGLAILASLAGLDVSLLKFQN
ncbi:MAG TPA: serine hydrolase domain-containing protein [Candidatus Hydrogenedentes bacterium]|nr:serine hydrolase domain-containing protein [Candidatus Hydrogenedentota bacterium]